VTTLWQQRSFGHGSKDERRYDVAVQRVTVKGQQPAAGFEHLLLIRCALTAKVTKTYPDGYHEIAYLLVHAPTDTGLHRILHACGSRWAVEDDNEVGKDQLGLGDYQVRKWVSWYRHVTISMLAHAFLAVTHADLGKTTSPTLRTRHPTSRRRPVDPDRTPDRGHDPWAARRDRPGTPLPRHDRRDRPRLWGSITRSRPATCASMWCEDHGSIQTGTRSGRPR
jgi:hypothetical protein